METLGLFLRRRNSQWLFSYLKGLFPHSSEDKLPKDKLQPDATILQEFINYF